MITTKYKMLLRANRNSDKERDKEDFLLDENKALKKFFPIKESMNFAKPPVLSTCFADQYFSTETEKQKIQMDWDGLHH